MGQTITEQVNQKRRKDKMSNQTAIIQVNVLCNSIAQSGVSISVYAGNDGPPATPVSTAITDNQGNAFLTVPSPSGSYVVRQTISSGFIQNTPANNLGIHILTVLPNNDYTAFFANSKVAMVAVATIKANVTAGGSPQSGVSISIYPGDLAPPSPAVTSGLTDVQGNAFITFSEPGTGSFVIRQTPPQGFVQSVPANNFGIHLNSIIANNDYSVAFVNIASAPTPPLPPLPPLPPVPPVPPVPPTPPIPPVPPVAAFSLGINSSGVTDAACDATVHPQILSLMSDLEMVGNRFWGTEGFTRPASSSQWAITSKHRYPIAVFVLNFQNSANRTKAPAMSDWVKYLTSLPPSSVTGWTHVEIGNEIISSIYWTDTDANYLALIQAAYPILQAKGYKVILSNVFTLAQLTKYGNLCKPYFDCCGIHAYNSNSNDSANTHKAGKAYADSIGKEYFCTELGLHMGGATAEVWANEIQKLIAAIKIIGGTYLYFAIFYNTTQGAGPEGLMISGTYAIQQPFYNAIKSVMNP